MKNFRFANLFLFLALFAFSSFVFAQVSPKIELSGQQKEIFNENFPENVRNFLETADKFEIFMHAEKREGKLVPAMQREFKPNFKAEITNKNLRKSVLDSFYKESATEEMGAICYLPSHSLRASKGNEFVEIEICFGCRKFYANGLFGKFNGTLSSEFQETEAILNKIIEDSGTNYK